MHDQRNPSNPGKTPTGGKTNQPLGGVGKQPATNSGQIGMAGPHNKPTQTPIEEHVKTHGPAHAAHHMHDKDGGGKHHVTTHHGDGGEDMMHHSVHDTGEAAADHIKAALGGGEPQDHEEVESPDTEANEQARESGGGGIPGLAS
jgi:hypothetical protein